MNGSKVLAALVGFALVACADSPSGVSYPRVDRVDVGPVGATLSAGDTQRLTAYPRTADGTVLGGPVTWRSLDARVATVSASGIVATVQAHAAGSVVVEAQYEDKVGQVMVTVAAAPLVVATVEVLPTMLTLLVGQDVGVEAVAKTADGIVVGGRTVQWSTSNPTIVTVDSHGNDAFAGVRAQGPGLALVRAEIDGVRGEAAVAVSVVAPGARAQRVAGHGTAPVTGSTLRLRP